MTVSPPPFSIRPLRPSDFEAICELWCAAGLPTRPSGRDSREAFLTQLANFPTTYLAAECDGTIVGTVLGTHDGRKGWINRLAVHPEHRRRGIATALLDACERALRDDGIEIIAALIEPGNAVSQSTFKRAGYSADMPVRYLRKASRPDA